MPTLAQLLTPKTRSEREAQLMAALNNARFPVTDWYVGAVGRTLVKMIATGLVDFDALVPQIAAGGFIGPFEVGDAVYPSRAWLELLAVEVFGVTPAPATYTVQMMSLWCTPLAGSYDITPGMLTAVSEDGRRYTNLTGGTVPIGTTPPTKLYLPFRAEAPGAEYNGDLAGSIRDLVTPLPGLVVLNELADFGGLDQSSRAARNGSGTGTVTPTRTSPATAPPGARSYALTIITAGDVGAAAGSLLIDDGDGNPTTTVLVIPLPASYAVGDGVTLVFADGGQSPGFLAGEIYTWQTPGSSIINAGTDAESDESLRARMRARWPSLGVVPTEDRYAAWVRQASIEAGYGVTKVTTFASSIVAGQTEIRVAAGSGGVPGIVVAALQAYINARDGITDLANVASATSRPVEAGGIVTIRRASAAAVKAAALIKWLAYIAELPIGGDRPDQVVRLAELEQALMDAGAVDVDGLTLNGAPENYFLGDTEVAVAATPPWPALEWREVP